LSIPHWEESLSLKPDESQFREGSFGEFFYGFMPDSTHYIGANLGVEPASKIIPNCKGFPMFSLSTYMTVFNFSFFLSFNNSEI
jgi:hypothetical protein